MSNITDPGRDPVSAIFGGDVTGVNKQARAAQGMAEAEQAARGRVTTEARAASQRANLAAQSPQQLAILERGLSAAQTQVDTDLRQLAAIDPAIMEASKQVLGLLQGKQAAVNDPMMRQRSQQRQQLVDSLKSQYGPGAESSSVGQRALQQFDTQSDSMFQQNQMSSLGQVMGIASTRIQGPGFGQLMQASQGFGNYQDRILSAQMGGDANILQAMGGEVQGAGAGYVGDMIHAGAQRQVATGISNDGRSIGRAWGSMGMGNMGGKGGGQQASTGDTGFNMNGPQNNMFSGSNPYADSSMYASPKNYGPGGVDTNNAYYGLANSYQPSTGYSVLGASGASGDAQQYSGWWK